MPTRTLPARAVRCVVEDQVDDALLTLRLFDESDHLVGIATLPHYAVLVLLDTLDRYAAAHPDRLPDRLLRVVK